MVREGTVIRRAYLQRKFGAWETHREVIVIPKSFRKGIAHDKGGHLGSEKSVKGVSRYFMWPGMTKEIIVHCKACTICQAKSKHYPPKTSIVERPILSEPFE